MTDILDEILAFTEGYKRDASAAEEDERRRQEHQQQQVLSSSCQSNPSALSVPQNTAAVVASTLSSQQYFPPQFAPSPRGIQDDLSAFALIHRPAHSFPKNELVVSTYNQHRQPQHHHRNDDDQHEQEEEDDDDDDDATAAAVAAAISNCISSSAPQPTHQSHLNTTTSTPTSNSNPNTSHRPNLTITPTQPSASHPINLNPNNPMSYQAINPSTFAVIQGAPWSAPSPANKRNYAATIDSDPRSSAKPHPGDTQQHLHHHSQPPEKKPKPDISVVMPPSAKSILERRERAIREGRRKDAKLSDAERRILRRLRNRESAERCRLRRVQQAAELEKKIASMQVENKRLVAMAEQYEKTIKRLEQVIADFSAQQQQNQSQQGQSHQGNPRAQGQQQTKRL